MPIIALVLALPAGMTSIGCGASDRGADDASETTATTTVASTVGPDRSIPADGQTEPVPSSSEPPPVTGEVPEGVLDEILADASERLAVDLAELVVVRAEAVTWPDGSLGCPEPGVVYTQALVPGYWVVVVADDQQLDYRVGRQGGFLLCEDPTTAVPPGAGADSTD